MQTIGSFGKIIIINKLGTKKCNRIPNTGYKDGLICDDEDYVLDK